MWGVVGEILVTDQIALKTIITTISTKNMVSSQLFFYLFRLLKVNKIRQLIMQIHKNNFQNLLVILIDLCFESFLQKMQIE